MCKFFPIKNFLSQFFVHYFVDISKEVVTRLLSIYIGYHILFSSLGLQIFLKYDHYEEIGFFVILSSTTVWDVINAYIYSYIFIQWKTIICDWTTPCNFTIECYPDNTRGNKKVKAISVQQFYFLWWRTNAYDTFLYSFPAKRFNSGFV